MCTLNMALLFLCAVSLLYDSAASYKQLPPSDKIGLLPLNALFVDISDFLQMASGLYIFVFFAFITCVPFLVLWLIYCMLLFCFGIFAVLLS